MFERNQRRLAIFSAGLFVLSVVLAVGEVLVASAKPSPQVLQIRVHDDSPRHKAAVIRMQPKTSLSAHDTEIVLTAKEANDLILALDRAVKDVQGVKDVIDLFNPVKADFDHGDHDIYESPIELKQEYGMLRAFSAAVDTLDSGAYWHRFRKANERKWRMWALISLWPDEKNQYKKDSDLQIFPVYDSEYSLHQFVKIPVPKLPKE